MCRYKSFKCLVCESQKPLEISRYCTHRQALTQLLDYGIQDRDLTTPLMIACIWETQLMMDIGAEIPDVPAFDAADPVHLLDYCHDRVTRELLRLQEYADPDGALALLIDCSRPARVFLDFVEPCLDCRIVASGD